MSITTTKIDDEMDLVHVLAKEALIIPSGFEEEIYYNKERKEISFSSPKTHSTLTRSNDILGRLKSMSFDDVEGFKNIDDDFIEVDDECNKIDQDFKDKDYERYYKDSSIITRDEAIDRILNTAEGVWFEEQRENYKEVIKEVEV
jgi:hypothetical protein